MSADGRYVAFESQSDGLAPGEDDQVQGVFVRDTLTGKTTLVSRATGANGAAADADSTVEAISDNGRRVLFNTTAANLGAPSSGSVVYVRDLDTNATTIISRVNGPDGTIVQAQGLDLSGDGNRVVFLTARRSTPTPATASTSTCATSPPTARSWSTAIPGRAASRWTALRWTRRSTAMVNASRGPRTSDSRSSRPTSSSGSEISSRTPPT